MRSGSEAGSYCRLIDLLWNTSDGGAAARLDGGDVRRLVREGVRARAWCVENIRQARPNHLVVGRSLSIVVDPLVSTMYVDSTCVSQMCGALYEKEFAREPGVYECVSV